MRTSTLSIQSLGFSQNQQTKISYLEFWGFSAAVMDKQSYLEFWGFSANIKEITKNGLSVKII